MERNGKPLSRSSIESWIRDVKEHPCARLIEILLLEALTLQVTEGLRALERAVTSAEKGGYVRLFVDERAACADLLRQGLSIGGWALTNGNGVARSYARRLLAICDGHDPFGGVPHIQAQLALDPDLPVPVRDALSAREIEVLRLIADGASNQEIAAALVISLGTVKSHLNHIMSKLQAHNRTEAVAHARKLGCLAA